MSYAGIAGGQGDYRSCRWNTLADGYHSTHRRDLVRLEYFCRRAGRTLTIPASARPRSAHALPAVVDLNAFPGRPADASIAPSYTNCVWNLYRGRNLRCRGPASSERLSTSLRPLSRCRSRFRACVQAMMASISPMPRTFGGLESAPAPVPAAHHHGLGCARRDFTISRAGRQPPSAADLAWTVSRHWGQAISFDDMGRPNGEILYRKRIVMRSFRFLSGRAAGWFMRSDFSARRCCRLRLRSLGLSEDDSSPTTSLIAENEDLNDSRCPARSRAADGALMSAQWSDDFHRYLQTLLAGKSGCPRISGITPH